MSNEDNVLGAVAINDLPCRPDYMSVILNGFEGLDMHGYFSLPETATLKQIKDFQQQSEAMIAELKNDIFKDS